MESGVKGAEKAINVPGFSFRSDNCFASDITSRLVGSAMGLLEHAPTEHPSG